MRRRYRVIDVFADQRFQGNPLTVVLDTEGLSSVEMQRIARETNHSETTFVTSDGRGDGSWGMRIFTPSMELPFAGHPTLGTAATICDVYGVQPPLQVRPKAGRIDVHRRGDVYWMSTRPPRFMGAVDSSRVARSLNLRPSDVDRRWPVELVSAGLPFYIVPARSLAAVQRSALDLQAFCRAAGVKPHGVLAFSQETVDRTAALHVRCFTEAYGIPEDPATGSGAGALAAWLSKHEVLGEASFEVAAEQGLEIGRPSKLWLRAWRDRRQIRVAVGGSVAHVAEGAFV